MARTPALALAILAACSSSTGPGEWQRVIGAIDPTLSSVQLVSGPIEVTAGVPFTITVTTLGSSSCTREDGATRQIEGQLAIVTPWDLVLMVREGFACTEDLGSHPRDVTITFANAGEGRIRIVGTTLVGSDPTTYEFTIPVRAAGS